MTSSLPILRLRRVRKWLECELTDPKSMQITSFDQRPIKLTEAFKKDILRPYKKLLRMARDEETRAGDFGQELRVIGSEIYQILHPIFRRFDMDVREGTALALALDEETVDIPWELALLQKKPCIRLCESVNVGRLRVVKSERWFNPSERRRKRRALVVGINYKDCGEKSGELDWAESEAEEVASILEGHDIQVTLLPGKKAKRKRIVKELKYGLDIFHFTGHGSMTRDESRISACDGDLLAKDLHKILGTVAPRLSFMNACETAIERATIGEAKWDAYSWAYALAEQGGRVFIGTLWPIYEEEARLFSCRFYKELLGVENRTLADSVRQARLKVKKGDSDKSVFTWPAYVLYGPPSLQKDDILD